MPRTKEQIRDDFLRVMQELRMVLRTEDVPEKLLLLMVGYAHPSSKGYLKAKSYFRKANYIVLSKGCVSFTEEGRRNAPQDVIPPKDNSEVQVRLRGLVLKKDKVPPEKLNIVWGILLDGKSHTKEGLLKATGYNHPSSKGFLKIMAAMKELGIIEKVGSNAIKFTKIVFPFAAPGASDDTSNAHSVSI